MGGSHRTSARLAVAATVALMIVTPTGAHTKPRAGNHCINPVGADLNEVYGTDDAFIAPFCTTARVGDWWRPIVRLNVAGTFESVPPGYVPWEPTPMEDLLAKFESATYVVDAGTKRERSYTYELSNLITTLGTLPDGSDFLTIMPRLRPLPAGNHTVDVYVTLAEDHWDGFATAPENFIPSGTSLANPVSFVVKKR